MAKYSVELLASNVSEGHCVVTYEKLWNSWQGAPAVQLLDILDITVGEGKSFKNYSVGLT